MEFRPCIDIHNGKVKQIVGSSLKDAGGVAKENFVSDQDGAYFGGLYRDMGLYGGHIILLNQPGTIYYEQDKKQAYLALEAFPGGLMVGGGVNAENAMEFLYHGASHVIVTSYVFRDGQIDFDRLEELEKAVGREHICLDMSCKRVDDSYYVVTDRWQKLTQEELSTELLDRLANYCDEFLIHAVDVEGKSQGIELGVVDILCGWNKLPVTYAGGVKSLNDLRILKSVGRNQIHVTVGSALDLFGGPLAMSDILRICRE